MENRKSRRDFLKLLAGFGLGASAAEIYERLYNIPSLEKNFTVEISHWMRQYEEANQSLSNLQGTVSSMDALEKESVSAISFYQEKMQEAMEGLRRTLERYSAILGEDRVEFESHALKVLEDLKMTREKLEKLSKYFPLTAGLSYEPTRIINDKICDLNVSFDVISPLNTLSEVEVSLIPVEYKHLPREAFPQEEIRVVKLQPRGLEREIFSADFVDLKGGREYLLKTVAKDVADNIKETETKTPYIREFENLGKQLYDKGIVIGVSYYEYYPDPIPWEGVTEPIIVRPLLGKYNVRDPIVIAKHIDWATGHGINCYFLSWGWDDEINHKKYHDNIVNLVSSPYINQLHIAIQYEISRLPYLGVVEVDEYGKLHLNDPEKWGGAIEDFKVLNNTFFHKENFLKINDKPVVYWYSSDALVGKVGDFLGEGKAFLDEIRSTHGTGIFMISDHANPYVMPPPGDWWLENATEWDGWTTWAAGWYIPVEEPRDENFPKVLEKGYKFWNNTAETYKKLLMPSIISGFVELRNPDWVATGRNLPRDVDMFSKELDIALKYAIPVEGKKIIKIDTWNDFGEGDAIEPTIEERFKFLEVIKKFATSYLKE